MFFELRIREASEPNHETCQSRAPRIDRHCAGGFMAGIVAIAAGRRDLARAAWMVGASRSARRATPSAPSRRWSRRRPCPLILAAPAAFIGGTSLAARRGVLVKGGVPLETLARVHTVMFDKSGALTVGDARLVGVETGDGRPFLRRRGDRHNL
jgi:hypothetical protein